ncbi:MAG: FtsH protease activity modulator HflK [Candidatus Eisenbacteria bacterium]|uniref:Protein HflK n=1 Tax=Eiseniibacteriota bacterium TaxID=2212470 RepID=A0A948RU73_UNCEI|nr:FtsH protease activity modulator HflK [Candidatus Eisenbacteria bacterium]MBU1948126.1 FtsH protease activity modulator HflK [Candidatus Eisenbacteria bacterium]MBU2689789.1 FtsH protease activity modulator HflK [Candidatus Eisenbacteria bacterium]
MDSPEIRDIHLRLPSGRLIKYIIMAILVLVLVRTGFYTVGPEENGVITRFGAFVRTTEPGLHMMIPFGIEAVEKIAVQRQHKEEFGFRTLQGGVRTQYATRNYDEESLMLTGDLNAAQVEWVVQFRIVDPYKNIFRVREIRSTFRAMTEAVIRGVIGDRTVNEVITVGRTAIAIDVEQKLQILCDQYETGIRVDQVVLQDVNPPDPVKPSFNGVNEAQQERERLINEALAEYNRVIPRARGEALQTIQQAEGYYLDRINRARGDSARFVALYEAYSQAPEVTRKRIFLETMNDILPKAGKKLIIDDDVKGILPLLNLGAGQLGMDQGKEAQR